MNAKEGIGAKVTKPTSWISSMQAIEKLGKLHFCIDRNSAKLLKSFQEILPDVAEANSLSTHC